MSRKTLKEVSFIATVFNEIESIPSFLESLFSQKVLPGEVVIVDGGSTDGTFEKIKTIIEQNIGERLIKKKGIYHCSKTKDGSSISYKLLQSKGANISEGRNIAATNSTGKIICVSDAGCLLEKSWLDEVTKPIRKGSHEFCGGITLALAENVLQKALASCIIHKAEEIDGKKFMPSSRNLCFLKNTFRQIGGYPEYMDYGEDMKLNFLLRDKGISIGFIPEAKVFWRMRKDLPSIFRQFFRYAKGDAIGRMYPLRHMVRFGSFIIFLAILALSIFVSAYFLLAFIPLFVLYVLKPFSRVGFIDRMTKKDDDDPKKTYLIFILLIFLIPYIDTAKAFGYIYGLLKR